MLFFLSGPSFSSGSSAIVFPGRFGTPLIRALQQSTEFTRCRGSFLGLDAVRIPWARFSAPEKF